MLQQYCAMGEVLLLKMKTKQNKTKFKAKADAINMKTYESICHLKTGSPVY